MAVGVDVKELKVGDNVYYNKHVPHKLDVDGKKLLVVNEREIKVKESV